MRIGVNTLPLLPGQIGGMETYTVNLLTHLMAIDRQHQYYLFVARYNQHLFVARPDHSNVFKVRTLSVQGMRHAQRGVPKLAGSVSRRLPCVSRWLVNAVASTNMLFNIFKHKIDLWFCPLINLAPQVINLPSVVCIPDLQPELYPDNFRKDLADWYRRRIPASCRAAMQVLTLSDYSRNTIIERYDVNPEKVHVVPLAVSENFLFQPSEFALQEVREKYGLPLKYAFYPANTWPHKNHATLVRALHLLKTRYGIELICVFTGVPRGGHVAFLKIANELGLTGQIRLLGHVERCDMPLLYRSAHFLIFPSLFEGFGLPLLEAMASDCPVVCSNATSIPEVVGNAALLFDPHDPEAMADAMHRVLTDEGLRRALVLAGRERCHHFSWERTARETLKVLEEAASVGTPSRRPHNDP